MAYNQLPSLASADQQESAPSASAGIVSPRTTLGDHPSAQELPREMANIDLRSVIQDMSALTFIALTSLIGFGTSALIKYFDVFNPAAEHKFNLALLFSLSISLALCPLKFERSPVLKFGLGHHRLLFCVLIILITFITFKTSVLLSVDEAHIAMPVVLCACLSVYVMSLVAGSLARHPSLERISRRRIAIYGATTFFTQMRSSIESDTSVIYAGLFDQRAVERLPAETQALLTGSLDDLLSQIQKGLVNEVIVLLPDIGAERIQEIIMKISMYSTDIWLCTHLPLGCRITENAAFPVRCPDTVLTLVHRRAIADWGYIGKTVFDRTLASVLIALLSPLFLLITLAIKLETRGPVFFRQCRHGINGNAFSVWKFRSMFMIEDHCGVAQAKKDDPRVTRVGRIIRRTSIDELPQLLNIITGEMSFVGPRPHAIAHNHHYQKLIEFYAARNVVKPGLTGWAQVNGLRGETADDALMAARVSCDQWYIRNWSFWLDVKILLMTPYYGLLTSKAY
jgi:Undecaprenyl-phosphate glucose phosphotransferase